MPQGATFGWKAALAVVVNATVCAFVLRRHVIPAADRARDASVVQIRIRTGRTHQIRRHLAALGHPVLGDPRYGRGNADPRGLQLVAAGLTFRCPLRGDRMAFATDGGDLQALAGQLRRNTQYLFTTKLKARPATEPAATPRTGQVRTAPESQSAST